VYLDAVKDLRVLVVGDAIRDHYIFVRPLGKSTKESVLSVGYEREETYKGGVWAAAAHLAELCARVDVMHGPHVMVNTRFVEGPNNRKLFTLHRMHDEPAARMPDIGDYDLVIVADFGHGTLTAELIAQIAREARFLSVNAQTNSSNFGFNLVTRYPRADFVVIDELEARLAAQDRVSPIEAVIERLGFANIVVTLGGQGAIGYRQGEGFYREPARAGAVVDTMGAGDAFLAVASVFAAAGFPIRELVSIGNTAGAAKVGVVGHRRAVSKEDLESRT
jgi:bifunctional ADP-heptose synthase (sugar kinase/adenylyltransferase)